MRIIKVDRERLKVEIELDLKGIKDLEVLIFIFRHKHYTNLSQLLEEIAPWQVLFFY